MHKKKAEIGPGARVLVADPLDRWTQPHHGTVVFADDDGVKVRLDGEVGADGFYLAAWHDVDVEQKPRPRWIDVAVGDIGPSRWQYRHTFAVDSMLELADSIRRSGLINRPLVFRDEEGGYELIAGERRVRAIAAIALTDVLSTSLDEAVKLACAADFWDEKRKALQTPKAQRHTVPVEIRPGEAADFREIVILENLQREDPSPVEEAEGFKVLLDEEGYSQATLAKRLGKSQPYVAQRLSLLGLDAAARAAVAEHDVSFSAARAIAAVPAPVQAALTRHVVELNKTAADGGTTSRQVQAMATQLKRFLDPDAWTPDPGDGMDPRRRNHMRLVAHHLRSLDPARAESILALRHDGSNIYTNVTGRAPRDLAGEHHTVVEILRALLGHQASYDDAWRRAALANGWTCDRCRLQDAVRPAEGDRSPCERWQHQADPATITTCRGFVGPDEPIVLAINWDVRESARALGIPVLEAAGVNYVDDPAAYTRLQEGHARLQREREAQKKEEQSQAHLVDLRTYWKAQNDTRTLIEQDAAGELGRKLAIDHPQAHACRRCVHHTQGAAGDAGPEYPRACYFADHPVKVNDWSPPSSPPMGVLVRDDGLMVPRCARFRALDMPPLARLAGVRFPKATRPQVLVWLEYLARISGQYSHSHNNTVADPLSWLPYARNEEKEAASREKMVRWVRDHWDEIGGDEVVAGLLGVAQAEAFAGGKIQEPLELRNAATGEVERWVSIPWQTYVTGEPARYLYGAKPPAGWPTPYLRQPKPAPASDRLIDVVVPEEDPDTVTRSITRVIDPASVHDLWARLHALSDWMDAHDPNTEGVHGLDAEYQEGFEELEAIRTAGAQIDARDLLDELALMYDELAAWAAGSPTVEYGESMPAADPAPAPTAMWAPQPKNPYLAHYWTCDPEIRLWESACGMIGQGSHHDGDGDGDGNWQPTENDVIKRCATCERAVSAQEAAE